MMLGLAAAAAAGAREPYVSMTASDGSLEQLVMAEIDFAVATTRSVPDVKATIEAEIATCLPGGRIKRFWEGDVLRLVGMGADGRIEVRPGEIRATAML